MNHSGRHQAIIDNLYALYQSKGFVHQDKALDMMAAQNLTLQDTERVTGILLEMGVIFSDSCMSKNEDEIDRSKIDYEAIYCEVLKISSGMSVFINYLRGVSPPQWREWHMLIPQAQDGNIYARNRLFDMYLRIVVKLALDLHKNEGYELEDLIQEGALGLLHAIRKYDNGKHDSFGSYLSLWVMRYMSSVIAKKSRLIRIPAQTLNKLKRASNKSKKELRYIFSTADTANYLNPEAEIEAILNYMQEPIPIEEIATMYDDGFMEFEIVDKDMSPFFEIMLKESTRSSINSVLKKLTNREAVIIRLRFGLDKEKRRTLEEIGDMLELTRERIRQIESEALKKLQYLLKSKRL